MIINKNVIEILRQEGFHPDELLTQYYILYKLYHKEYDDLACLDDSLNSKRMIIQYYSLMGKGFLTENEDKSKFILTDIGASLVEKISEFIKEDKQEQPSSDNDFDTWFDSWMELWPSGVKTGGKLVKSDKKTCYTKMKKFLKDNKYSLDTILNVTQNYISEFEKNNYNFMKSATYFIDKKGEGSELAARCQDYSEDSKVEEYETFNQGGLI